MRKFRVAVLLAASCMGDIGDYEDEDVGLTSEELGNVSKACRIMGFHRCPASLSS